MQVDFKYGQGHITLELPDKQILAICRAHDLDGVEDPVLEIKRALQNPIDSLTLKSLAVGKKSAAVVVDDVSRPVPYPLVLTPVLDTLVMAGIPEERICVIAATGLHRPMTKEEFDKWVGPYKGRVQVENNQPDNPLGLSELGVTSLGTRISVNKKFMEAELKVLTGDVDYHQFCGYGGGAKSVFPGLSNREAIEANHSNLEIPGTGMGRIKGNPVRMEIDEVGRMAGVDFILNVVQNSKKEIVGAFAGDMISAHRAGAALVDRMYKMRVPCRADIVIASQGGYPRDIDLYQSQKALQASRKLVKDGGKIFILAECREGHGNDLFDEWMREATSAEEIISRIKKKFVMGGHKAYQYVRDIKGVEVFLYSALPPQQVKTYRLKPLDAPEEIISHIKPSDTIICLPDAAMTCVECS
ncbi:MAG: nickel-dependent lactate racemase [Armatimonadota bacterium]|nr:nickel-dependent lactate racemase [Armatimonadota bacterium]